MKREHTTGSRTADVSLRLSPLERPRDTVRRSWTIEGALFCLFYKKTDTPRNQRYAASHGLGVLGRKRLAVYGTGTPRARGQRSRAPVYIRRSGQGNQTPPCFFEIATSSHLQFRLCLLSQ